MRNDGNPDTHAFVASPELTTAFAIAGSLSFDPRHDYLTGADGEKFKLSAPEGAELPSDGFDSGEETYQPPLEQTEAANVNVEVRPTSKRLQLLDPFNAWDGEDMENMAILIKAKGLSLFFWGGALCCSFFFPVLTPCFQESAPPIISPWLAPG